MAVVLLVILIPVLLYWSGKMPVKKCNKDGKSGYKWGDQGRCYTGPGAKKKAIKQGMAIHANASEFKQHMEEAGQWNEVISELDILERLQLSLRLEEENSQ